MISAASSMATSRTKVPLVYLNMSVVLLSAEQAHLQEGKEQDENGHHQRQRSAVAIAAIDEGFLVDLRRKGLRGAVRSAAGQCLHLVEDSQALDQDQG